ncbi:MAG: rhomboid family intramembrane serine protease [Prevotellaceae bacterium]|jgi:membrane associated rhomboid family serine protease|nr:rhomboid family intramembrane serine protease [Prevotellaceae bacterium]
MNSSGSNNDVPEKRKFFRAAFFPVITGALILLCFLLEQGMDWDFYRGGIFPRRLTSLWGIVTMPFVHSDWAHLLNNLPTFVVLGTALYYFYNQIASKVLFFSCIFSGAALWFIGRDNWHVGASGVIYALAFFLALSGIIRRHIPLTAISFVIIFLYGSMVWHLFPWQEYDPVSWEGHLAGGITGFVLAIIYRRQGPQPPDPDWEDDEEEEDGGVLPEEERISHKNGID